MSNFSRDSFQIQSSVLIELLTRFGGQFFHDHIKIYSLSEIAERNETYETSIYCPNFLTIGDDSGGSAFVCEFDGSGPVYIVGHGSMSPDDFVEVHPSLLLWLTSGCPVHDI
jgi:hypothetical protein